MSCRLASLAVSTHPVLELYPLGIMSNMYGTLASQTHQETQVLRSRLDAVKASMLRFVFVPMLMERETHMPGKIVELEGLRASDDNLQVDVISAYAGPHPGGGLRARATNRKVH